MPLTRRALLPSLCLVCVVGPSAAADDDKAACVAASTRGQTQRDEKKLVAAEASFLACAKTSCPAIVRSACEGWSKEVGALVPTVVFRAAGPDGADLVDVTVTVDGVLVPTKLLGTAQPLDPGPHKVVFRHDTHGAVEVAVIAVEGEKGRLVRGELRAKAPAPVASTAAPLASTAAPPAPTAPPSRSTSALPYVALGTGIAALVGAGVFYLQYRSKNGDLAKACDADERCPPSARGTIDSANRAGLLFGVLGGAGVVLSAAGGYLLVSPRRDDRCRFRKV